LSGRPVEEVAILDTSTESSSGAPRSRIAGAFVTGNGQEQIVQEEQVTSSEPERLVNIVPISRLLSSATLRQAPNIPEPGFKIWYLEVKR